MKESLNFSDIVDSKLQNKINISIIFDYLRKNGPASRAGIVRDLSISRPTVSRIIEVLIKYDHVIETEKKVTKGGKRPILLKLSSPGKDAGVIGDSFYAIESIIMNDFPYKINRGVKS